MSDCPRCGNRRGFCQQCKMDALEDRHGVPSDYHGHTDADGVGCWVQAPDGEFHASMFFEEATHACACGEILECPVADVKHDVRRFGAVEQCGDCVDALEDDGEEPPDEGFEPATEIRADGGTDRHATDTVELRIRTDRINLAGIISVYGVGVSSAPLFGPGKTVARSALDGMDEVYSPDQRMSDVTEWSDRPSMDVDVELVELEDDPVTDHDDDDGADRDATPIAITDGGVDEAYLSDEGPHYCDDCQIPFKTFDGLANHVCRPEFQGLKPAATTFAGPVDLPTNWGESR